MSEQDYRTTMTVDATPEAAFAAINDVRGWWSRGVDGTTDVVGERFGFRGRREDGEVVHRALIEVTELVPGRRVAWRVVENHFTFVDDQSEWVDSRIVFDLAPTDAGTTIRFRHLGLRPDHQCFDVCSPAWTFFLHESLCAWITTGRGLPMAAGPVGPAVAASAVPAG